MSSNPGSPFALVPNWRSLACPLPPQYTLRYFNPEPIHMYKEHSCFATPTDDTRLRRYVDIGRFVSLLEKEAIWFACPSSFDDAWEGCYTKPHYDPNYVALSLRASGFPEDEVDTFVRIEMQSRASDLHLRDWNAVSCWHAGDSESDALWKLYAPQGGLAVVTDVARLKEALSATSDSVFVGAVSYLDESRDTLPPGNIFWPLVWKRRAFAHEHEVRAVVSMGTDMFENIREKAFGTPATNRLDPLPRGRYVPVKTGTLIESIAVHPLAPIWLLEAVQGLVQRYGLHCSVETSHLAIRPPVPELSKVRSAAINKQV